MLALVTGGILGYYGLKIPMKVISAPSLRPKKLKLHQPPFFSPPLSVSLTLPPFSFHRGSLRGRGQRLPVLNVSVDVELLPQTDGFSVAREELVKVSRIHFFFHSNILGVLCWRRSDM